MIIYGIKNRHLRSEKSAFTTCPGCGEKGKITIHLYGKYFHIFWIPFFPLSRNAIAVCDNCGHQMEVKNMPEDIKRDYDTMRAVHKTPVWFFSGMFVLVFTVMGVLISGEVRAKNTRKYLGTPMSGDVVEFVTETGNYSTMKINSVVEDSVIAIFNNYETFSKSDVGSILQDSSYEMIEYIIPIDELQRLYDVDTVIRVRRE